MANQSSAESYSEADHRFRFAAWCGATAARASRNCRFRVEDGVGLLRNAPELVKVSESLAVIPSKDEFDARHAKWCEDMLRIAPKKPETAKFTYGVVAKLINCYLKALTLDQLAERGWIHPPIDSLLLKELKQKDRDRERVKLWGRLISKGWSNFGADDYVNAIDSIRRRVSECGYPGQLWRIEEHWPGYQRVALQGTR